MRLVTSLFAVLLLALSSKQASAEGQRLRQMFDEGLQYVDFDAIWHDALTPMR